MSHPAAEIPTLAEGFPTILVDVGRWLHRICELESTVEGNWIWTKPKPGDAKTIGLLRPAGFRQSLKRPGWFFHVGLRWRAGDTVKLQDHYPYNGLSVQPFGPLKESMRPGAKPKTGYARDWMDQGRGIRARVKNDFGQILLTVDWLTRDWNFAQAQTEVLLARLESFQAVTFTLKAWKVPPPKPADLQASVQRDLSEVDICRFCLRRQHEFEESLNAVGREVAREKLAALVHDASVPLIDKARAELQALLVPGACQPDQVKKAVLALLVRPELALPPGMPDSIPELERQTGRTPRIRPPASGCP